MDNITLVSNKPFTFMGIRTIEKRDGSGKTFSFLKLGNDVSFENYDFILTPETSRIGDGLVSGDKVLASFSLSIYNGRPSYTLVKLEKSLVAAK